MVGDVDEVARMMPVFSLLRAPRQATHAQVQMRYPTRAPSDDDSCVLVRPHSTSNRNTSATFVPFVWELRNVFVRATAARRRASEAV
jgi:hypothetical protein